MDFTPAATLWRPCLKRRHRLRRSLASFRYNISYSAPRQTLPRKFPRIILRHLTVPLDPSILAKGLSETHLVCTAY